MTLTKLNGIQFSEMVLYGANKLTKHADYVDSLNVFPVPDGDTGTNMNLSMTSGANEVRSNKDEDISKVGSALSKGLLMGARGNSGVILSQLFRGFTKHFESQPEIDAKHFASALEAGVKLAYASVLNPVEGTILTVAKDASIHAVKVAKKEKSIVKLMEEVVKEANASLQRTPDLLPVLKEVGVVDSGGQGLVYVYEGFLSYLKGEDMLEVEMQVAEIKEQHNNVQNALSVEDIEFGYCTEYMIRLDEKGKKRFTEDKLRKELSKIGDSVLVVSDDEIVKVHVHTESPGTAFNHGQKFGSLINMKVDNMREQHASVSAPVVELPLEDRKPFGIVSISMGSGITDLFKELGVDYIVEGGQTMNPSTQDILDAVARVNAETVYVLPNNKNIILAAEQARDISDRDIVVVPSKSVPQGMVSLFGFDPDGTREENEESMIAALDTVRTGQITHAVRDTNISGVEISAGDYMGINEGKIATTDRDRQEASKVLLTLMLEGASMLTLIYGQGVMEDEVEELVNFCSEKFPDVEIQPHNGNQPLYPYIFSIE